MKARSLISGETWRKELNSEAFMNGLDCMIDFTKKYGREVGTEIFFSPKKRHFLYLNDIMVGDEKRVSLSKPVNLESVAKEFKERTGKEFIHAKRLMKEELLTFDSVRRFFNQIIESQLFEKEYTKTNPERSLTLPYPHSKESERNVSMQEYPDDEYMAIMIHTHPSSILIPSPNDLIYLQCIREKNGLRKLALKSKRKLLPNPIEIIVGPKKEEEYYPLLVFQEKSEEPNYFKEEFFTAIFDGFTKLPQCMDRDTKLLRRIFGIDEIDERQGLSKTTTIYFPRYIFRMKEK